MLGQEKTAPQTKI